MHIESLGDTLEQLVADRRARMVGAGVGALVLAVSLGLLVASKSPTRFKALSTHLPEHTLQIPILRSLPEPLPKANNGALAAARARQAQRDAVAARR